jgi:hypothetical protein
MSDQDYEQQMKSWERLYDSVSELMEKHGTEDSHVPGDYWVHDDYWGHPQLKIYVHDLKLLRPEIVRSLQKILQEFTAWEIFVTVAVRGTGESWPDMGLIVRAHEIVDQLERRHFPNEFQSLSY